MSVSFRPLHMDLPAVVKGDTFPPIKFVETSATANLARVRMKVKTAVSATASLTLDSDTTGMTINTATAGAWDFDLDQIDEVSLSGGLYLYDIETTDANGVVRTEFSGSWQILDEITD